MVGVCLGLQLVTYLIMYQIMRVGGRVFRPDEDDKMEAYRRIHGLGQFPDKFNGGMSSGESPPSWSIVSMDRTRQDSQATEDGAFLLPGPAISLQAAPSYMRDLSQGYPGYTASDISSLRSPQRNAEFGYGMSPELRGSDQPLLGSPALPPRPHHGAA